MQRLIPLVIVPVFAWAISFASVDTPLHVAAHHDDLATASQLIDAGADPGAANDYGVTPAHLACANRGDEMVAALLTAGADPNAATWNGETILMACARTGAFGAVKALLDHGADVGATERRNGQTALMWAAAGGHDNVAQLLVERGAKVTARSAGGFTPLLFTARSGDVESARVLLDAGAGPDERTERHGNTLVVAAAGGHEALALYLLERGADPDAADENNITALHHAVASGMAALNGVRYDPAYRVLPDNLHALSKALLEAGADPDRQIANGARFGPDGSPFEMEGMTPFLLAAVAADVELMRLFEAHGADPNIVAKGGTTALIAAARAACTGACAFKGGNKANDADTRRAYAAVEAIITMDIDINAKSDDGQTAMHMAAFTGADPIVNLLAKNGAEVNVVDRYGQTPWSMASGISPVLRYRGLYGNHVTTAALLETLGATRTSRDAMDPDAPPPPGQ